MEFWTFGEQERFCQPKINSTSLKSFERLLIQKPEIDSRRRILLDSMTTTEFHGISSDSPGFVQYVNLRVAQPLENVKGCMLYLQDNKSFYFLDV